MPTALKLKPCPGVSLVADKAIGTNATADALAQALSNYNLRMHDLQTEFIARKQKLLAVLHGIECGIWVAAYLWLGALDSPTDALLQAMGCCCSV